MPDPLFEGVIVTHGVPGRSIAADCAGNDDACTPSAATRVGKRARRYDRSRVLSAFRRLCAAEVRRLSNRAPLARPKSRLLPIQDPRVGVFPE